MKEYVNGHQNYFFFQLRKTQEEGKMASSFNKEIGPDKGQNSGLVETLYGSPLMACSLPPGRWPSA